MNISKVLPSFFIILSLCLAIDTALLDELIIKEGIYILVGAFFVNLLVTIKYLNYTSAKGSTLLALSLAADFNFIVAIGLWISISIYHAFIPHTLIILLAIGASIANIIVLIAYVQDQLILNKK